MKITIKLEPAMLRKLMKLGLKKQSSISETAAALLQEAIEKATAKKNKYG